MNDFGALTVVSLVTVTMTVRALWRLATRRATSQKVATVALVAWLVLAVPAVVTEVRHHQTQAAATSATRLVSGDPKAKAVCERWTANLVNTTRYAGWVTWGSNVAQLRASTCADLGSWLRSDHRHPTLGQVDALHVVAHEAVHVSGEHSEAKTECLAMEWDARVAEHLGASPQVAEQMAQTYRHEVYPHMPPEYRGDCAQLLGDG
ncbi:MAG: hypothetical protein FWF02_03415 [Micrococcales bacterium]|nr:hypothetical protein [Micrococcales bacterium]MCL2666737.1 hypothetical protein [Micrococcales bacterium]